MSGDLERKIRRPTLKEAERAVREGEEQLRRNLEEISLAGQRRRRLAADRSGFINRYGDELGLALYESLHGTSSGTQPE